MNAYELANEIEKGGNDGFYQDEMVAILRQQADRIAELEKKLDDLANEQLVKQQAEIEKLKKELYFKDYYEELPDTPVGILKSAVRKLTNEEIGDFTHRMVLCCQVHPSSADINVLGLTQIVEEIRNK